MNLHIIMIDVRYAQSQVKVVSMDTVGYVKYFDTPYTILGIIISPLMSSYRGIWVAHSAAQKHATRACKQRIISVGLEDGLVEDFLEKELCSKDS